MLDISQIKSRISCVEFAQRNNIPIRYSGDRCVSPFRTGAKNKTSFWCFNDHWTDFGSGQSGDVIDFAAYLLYDGNKGSAIRELARLTGVENTNDNSQEWVSYTQNLCNQIEYWHQNLTDDDRNYIHHRGITDETINRVKLGRTTDGRLSFPYWKNGYICYYATRSMPGGRHPDRKYMKMPIDDFNDHTIWGLHTLDRNPSRDLLVIAEGAFDALSFEQENYTVISAITGFFSKDQLPTALSIAKSFKQVFLIYDNDVTTHAGEKFTEKMAKILTENRIPCLIGTVPFPHKYKDVSDYYADGNSLADLISTAVDGVTFLANKITDPEEFETFARRVCRYLSAPQVDVFFSKITADNFNADFIRTLQKECRKAPPDDIIAKEIISQHKLLYNPKTSFFEYNGRYWEEKTDTEIENYISKALGIYSTGPRLSSISRVVKSLVVTNQILNMNPVVNFINGTLELTETEPYFNFRDHSPSDLCTYCLDYPYVPGAVSQEWQQFIDSVTDFDGRRASFLQEFAGYILFPDNRLQKSAALIGEGSNGKSVYFNALANVFDRKNLTHIELSQFGDKFQLVNMQTAMLNISGEIKNDISSSEDIIKSVIAGDVVSACHKGKPFIYFKPRTKLIVSMNNYPKFSDKSDAITRRFTFCEFPLKFVEVPKEPNERLIDRTLESTFAQISHLSGIFNWVLDGYLMVRRCGYLTETYEHQTVLNEFKEDSDPTITFVRQLTLECRIKYADLYNIYKRWCDENGYRPEPSRTALRSIGKHIKSFRKDIKQGVSNSTRYVEPIF
jgi:putative DNA primase/helicase